MMGAPGKTTFSFQMRVLLCERCGAPIDVAVAGGATACKYCGAQSVVAGRDERAIFQLGVSPAQLPEPERIARLRQQDNQPLLPPAGLEQLVPGGNLEAWRVQEAMAVWQATRQALRQNASDYLASERLLFLTQVLSGHLAQQNDSVRQRAMLESALEAFTLPRQRQLVLCMLSRAACRVGDPEAAEAWLTPCDARSDDLLMDSQYRFSRAYLDTARGNFQGVIAALGRSPEEIPVHDSLDVATEVLRANAWERMGQLPAAVAQLQARMARGAGFRMGVEGVIKANPALQLCPHSFQASMAQQDQSGAAAAASMSGGGVGTILMATGAFMILIGVIVSISSVVGELGNKYAGVGDVILSMLSGIIVVPIGGGMILFGWKMRKAGERAKYIRLHGVRGTARVQHVSTTGVLINGVPRLRFDIAVTIPGRPEYAAQVLAVVSGGGSLAGQTVAVRVDPQDPSGVVIEFQ